MQPIIFDTTIIRPYWEMCVDRFEKIEPNRSYGNYGVNIVYFLFHLDELVYVGSTKYLSRRLANHRKTKEFDSVKIVIAGEYDDNGLKNVSKEFEEWMIWKLKPELNNRFYRPKGKPELRDWVFVKANTYLPSWKKFQYRDQTGELIFYEDF